MSSEPENQHKDNKPTDERAVRMIRDKIDALYGAEPDARQELLESAQAGKHRSKHQKFMYDLSTSGKSLAEIQTAWHDYYVRLPDNEKHEVWQEFYDDYERTRQKDSQPAQPQHASQPPQKEEQASNSKPRTEANVKSQLLDKVTARGKLSKKQHLKSLLFGLSMGSLVILVFLFSFFNERFIAPFVTPSRSVSSTPIVIDPGLTAVGPEPEVIIPKINVEVPVVYDVGSTDEQAIQAALERGVVHYPTTPNPGQKGNSVIVGHSSNNIFNKGKYKFAFVLLNKLETGDLFYLTKDGVRYAYRVYEKRIVSPTDTSVLGPTSKPATATLITCDPPGTSINRLIVVGEQISPDPSQNAASTAQPLNQEPAVIPGNAPSLWSRITDWIF